MSQIDKEQIAIMIKDIERYFADLKTIQIETKRDFEIPEKRHAVSMLVFSVINRSIDISNEIIAGSRLQAPGTYRDSFEILQKAKIISIVTSNKMIFLAKYRNIIAHQYYILTSDELNTIRKKIYEVENFVEEIKKYMRK